VVARNVEDPAKLGLALVGEEFHGKSWDFREKCVVFEKSLDIVGNYERG
jgi:hypothetical protein